MSPMQKLLKVVSTLLIVLAIVLFSLSMLLFMMSSNVVAVIMTIGVAACIVLDAMLGLLGRGAAADPSKAIELKGTIFVALAFNAATLTYFAFYGGIVAPVAVNAGAVLVFAVVAHLVSEQTKRG